jgi:hypothetical protein
MKTTLTVLLCLLSLQSFAAPVSIVKHHWITKIVDSRNNVTIRPGSVYDIRTYFEQRIGWSFKPKFRYLFYDTGLGTADPIYPIFQVGKQKGWHQLIPALLSDKNRHIDHYSSVEVPEGCRVDSAYWVRHIDEFPDRYHEERKAGYTLVDIGFDYYEKLKPDAECGRHKSWDAVAPKENPVKLLKKYAKKFKDYDDIPKDILRKLETKIGLMYMVDEKFGKLFGKKKWPSYKKA